MGVILYAMLSATLPFDDPDLRVMMSKTKKGHYEVPKCVSPEAEDLIKRMLQVNPDRRISLRKIWRHPLVQKYSYLDDFGNNNGELPDTRKGFQFSPVPKKDIDAQLLRQLRSMWHMFNESDLALKLTCDEYVFFFVVAVQMLTIIGRMIRKHFIGCSTTIEKSNSRTSGLNWPIP
jgi:serine/threonine protein kinase